MNWISTPESSNITRFSYDENNQVLMVEFKRGELYNYFDVPKIIFDQMIQAASKGQFLSQNVKKTYRYARA